MKKSLALALSLCASAACAETVTQCYYSVYGNDSNSGYSNAKNPAGTQPYAAKFVWSDEKAPHAGADYVVPAGYSLGIGGPQGPVDFGGDSLDVFGDITWYGGWDAKLNCTKTITMETGSKWYIQSYGNYNYAPFVIKGTREKPVLFYTSGARDQFQNVYMYGKISTPDETSAMKIYCFEGASVPYGRYVNFNSADLSEFSGTIIATDSRSRVCSSKFVMPGSLEAVEGGWLRLTGSAAESTLGNLTLDGTATLEMTAAKNTHVVNVTNKLVVADGAKLILNKINAIPLEVEPNRYPVFRLTKEAFENPDTYVGTPKISAGWSIDELPHCFLYTNLLDNGGAEIGFTHVQIVQTTQNGGWGTNPFHGTSAPTVLSDGRVMHDCDYYFKNYTYPLASPNPYVCPALYVLFPGQQNCWYGSTITISNAVLRGSGDVGVFRSYDSGHSGYTLRGKLRVVPDANGAGWYFRSRHSHTDALQCDISGAGLLKFDYDPSFKDDAVTRWYCTYALSGDNRDFRGTMSFTMSADGTGKGAFDDKGLEPFVQGPYSNITVKVNNPYSFGGALDAFDPAAITVNNENRIEATEDIAFADLNRGWTFTAKGYLRVPTGKTLTLCNRVAIGGTLVKESAGALVLGGSLSATADAEARPVFKVAAGALTLAPTSTVSGVELVCAKGLAPVIEAKPSADAAAKGANLSGTKVSVESVRVAWTGLDQLTDDGLQFAVATLDTASTDGSTTAAEFANLLTYTRVPGFKRIVIVADNGDGTSTVRCSLEKHGLMLIVR